MTRGLMFSAIVAALLGLGAIARAQADEPTAPKMPAPEATPATVFTYGQENPGCLEWTNACQTCVRNEAGVATCSTPGIACQPGALVCRQMKAK